MTMVAVMPCHALPGDVHTPTSPLCGSFLMPRHQSPMPKPKLSLNTSVTSPLTAAFSSNGNNLALDTLSVISPTSRNTLHNTYSIRTYRSPQSAAPQSAVPRYSPRVDIKVTSPKDNFLAPSPRSFSYRITSPSSPRRNLPLDNSFRVRKLPGRSALKSNSRNRMNMLRSPTAARQSEKKRVAFRTELTETISTNVYVTAHSDLLLSPGVDRSVMMLPSPTFPTGNPRDNLSHTTSIGQRISPLPFASRTESRTESRWRAAIEAADAEQGVADRASSSNSNISNITGRPIGLSVPVKRGSTSSEDASDDEYNGCPATPIVQSRRKRSRHWAQ